MSVSYGARRHRADVRLVCRTFHGVERPSYDDVASLSPREARALAAELTAAADDVEASAGQARAFAIASACRRLEALQAEVARLESEAAAT